MALSTRNRTPAEVTEVVKGEATALVSMRAGETTLVALRGLPAPPCSSIHPPSPSKPPQRPLKPTGASCLTLGPTGTGKPSKRHSSSTGEAPAPFWLRSAKMGPALITWSTGESNKQGKHTSGQDHASA